MHAGFEYVSLFQVHGGSFINFANFQKALLMYTIQYTVIIKVYSHCTRMGLGWVQGPNGKYNTM